MTDLQTGLREGPQEDVGTIVHELAEATGQMIAEHKRTQEKMLEISWKDREVTRSILLTRAEELRKEYPEMTVPEIRRHLIQMVTVSV